MLLEVLVAKELTCPSRSGAEGPIYEHNPHGQVPLDRLENFHGRNQAVDQRVERFYGRSEAESDRRSGFGCKVVCAKGEHSTEDEQELGKSERV